MGGETVYKIESKDGRDIRREVFELCARNNTPILSMETVTSSLEDVFLNVTKDAARGKRKEK